MTPSQRIIKDLQSQLALKDKALDMAVEGLRPFAEIYDTWCSINGNPMIIVYPQKCKLAKDSLHEIQQMRGGEI